EPDRHGFGRRGRHGADTAQKTGCDKPAQHITSAYFIHVGLIFRQDEFQSLHSDPMPIARSAPESESVAPRNLLITIAEMAIRCNGLPSLSLSQRPHLGSRTLRIANAPNRSRGIIARG